MLLTNNKMSIRSLSDILNHSQTIEKDKRFIEKCTIEKSLKWEEELVGDGLTKEFAHEVITHIIQKAKNNIEQGLDQGAKLIKDFEDNGYIVTLLPSGDYEVIKKEEY